jgi:hypothetical protein
MTRLICQGGSLGYICHCPKGCGFCPIGTVKCGAYALVEHLVLHETRKLPKNCTPESGG